MILLDFAALAGDGAVGMADPLLSRAGAVGIADPLLAPAACAVGMTDPLLAAAGGGSAGGIGPNCGGGCAGCFGEPAPFLRFSFW